MVTRSWSWPTLISCSNNLTLADGIDDTANSPNRRLLRKSSNRQQSNRLAQASSLTDAGTGM